MYRTGTQGKTYFDDKQLNKTSCRRAAATICPAPLLPRGHRSASRGRTDGNIAAVSHGQHVPTPTTAAA